MAQVEPMDIDDIESDFDNKENSSHHSNVLPRTPCMEKGYEELDVSELNMKLRYSITPAASPMSRSLNDSENNTTARNTENNNLTHSLNSAITKSEVVNSVQSLPLHIHTSDTVIDDRNPSVLRTIQSVTLSGAVDNDENMSLPSTSSSVTHTPEATTPTKEIPKHDGSSPIMRGLKSVLNMFRSSQSPIPPAETTISNMKQESLSVNDSILEDMEYNRCQTVVVSTPIANNRKVTSESRRSSPLKDSIVFNDDLEKDLQWKDETTIFFKDEKIPVHKLFPSKNVTKTLKMDKSENKNVTEEYMSMSNNASACQSGNTMNMQLPSLQNEISALESDGEFVDCEMTLNGESYYSKLAVKEDNACDITRNDDNHIHDNTKQVIDNIEGLLTDCEENKSYVIYKLSEITGDISTAINSDHKISLNCDINDQKEFESKINVVYDCTSDRVPENNVNTSVMPGSCDESIQRLMKNDLSVEENTTEKCDLINDYNEKNHLGEVPLPNDNNDDFIEFPNTTDVKEPKVICTIEQQDLNQTDLSVDYSNSVVTQSCKHVQNEYELKLDQYNLEATNLKPSDKIDVSVTKETPLQPVCLHKQGDCMKSQIIDSVDTPVNVSVIPVNTETYDQKQLTDESMNKDDKHISQCVANKETNSEKLTLEEYKDPCNITEHGSLNNCKIMNTATNEQNTIAAKNLFDDSAVKDHQVLVTNSTISMICDLKETDKESNSFMKHEKMKTTMDEGDETVVIESNFNDLSDKLPNFDSTYSNQPNDCAMNTTFNMDANKEIKFENIISMDKVKQLVHSNVLNNTAINDHGESNREYEDLLKDKNIKVETIMDSVLDKENGSDCFNNKKINVFNSRDIVSTEENKTVVVSDILNPEKHENLQLGDSLNVKNSLNDIHETYVTPDIPSNLPEQDTFVDTIEVVACQTDKMDSKYAMNKQNVSQERFATNFSMHEKDNDSSVKSSEPKNVFNLPEMSSAFISKVKENASSSSTPDLEDGSKHIFKVPSSNLTHFSQKCDVNTQDVDRKLSVDKNELDSSDVSTSSQASEATVHEVNTEDDDTVEASFFESEEFNDVDKKCDHEDMIDFSDIPTQKINNNAYKGEMFIDAEAFQFLLNQNKSNVVADSGRESLFLKFDPLFARRMSTDAATISQIQKGQSTPKRISKALSNIDFYKNANETTESTLEANFEDATVLLSKPMMVVNPAVNSVFSPRNKSCTPPRANRRSHTFTSPAIAVIDRLLSLSGDNSALNLEMSMTDVRGRTNETDQVLTQLRELLAEKEINVHGLRSESKELSERLRTLESQVKTLETEGEQRLRKVDDLNKCLAEKTKMNKGMAVVVEEYERTIASLTAEIEQDKKAHAEERLKLINERNEQNAHLASMTMSFNDLHSKYEKNKQIILNCKDNEDKYKRSIKEFDENVLKIQNNYELLKQHATSNLNNKNDEFDKLNKTHEAEVLKYGAMIKRKEMDISSLKETLAQKIKANEELTAICDELLNKVA